MKWFEPIILIIAILLVVMPIARYFVNKKNNTLKCECGHLQSECTKNCITCSLTKKSNNTLTYIVGVEGMKCGMCESHINDLIRKEFNVEKVKSSRKLNQTIIESKCFININDIKKAINNSGYNVVSIHIK